MASLPPLAAARAEAHGYRLVNSKYPPVALFDDVADAADFEALYALQALTNPRLRTEVGELALIPREQIPFGIPGCAYATAPFTHVNPAGSRFSDGRFGVLYLGESLDTALAEVRHHQADYWSRVEGLQYERFVFRGLACRFDERDLRDATGLPLSDPLYDPDDYRAAQQLGATLRADGYPGLRYHSVRRPGGHCWALFTPQRVIAIVQAAHYEMVWNGAITSVAAISPF